ncbi:MAG: hypothetical protein ACXWQ5_00390 [Ktedonobacterales bacterium]
MLNTTAATADDLAVLRKLYLAKRVVLVYQPHFERQKLDECRILGYVSEVLSIGVVLDDETTGQETFYPWSAIFRLYIKS